MGLDGMSGMSGMSGMFGIVGAPSTLLVGLNAFWKLNEASGQRVDSGDGMHLADFGSVGQASGMLGNAALFSDSNYLLHGPDPILSPGDVDFTLSAWVYLASKGHDRGVLAKWGPSGSSLDFEYLIWFASGLDRFQFGVANTPTYVLVSADALGSPILNTWYHIVCWHDSAANTVNIQANNGAVNSLPWTYGMRITAFDFAIGRLGDYGGTTVDMWDGRMQNIGLWSRLLTSEEREMLWNSGAGKTYPF